MDAQFIANALKTQRHTEEAWIFATEVQTSTGYAYQHHDGPGGIRRIDAFALALWPSKNYQRIAYEIKVSRSDWLNEIENPMKRVQAWQLSNEFWFAIPEGIIHPGDWRRDMVGCGLMFVHENGRTEISTRARKREYVAPMPMGFIASLMRCARNQSTQTMELPDAS